MYKWAPKSRPGRPGEGAEVPTNGHESQARWVVAGTATAVIFMMVAGLFSEVKPLIVKEMTYVESRNVTLVGERHKVVNDESALLDPTPLFLPTRWNATQREVLAPDFAARFQGYDSPHFSFSESELKLGLPDPITVPKSPAEAVSDHGISVVLAGFGETDGPVPVPGARAAFVEIMTAADGRNLLTHSIPGALPTKGNWQPMELVARIDAAGLVGPLVVTTRSGVEEVDRFVAKYLAQTLRIGERLDPGFYRICVGP